MLRLARPCCVSRRSRAPVDYGFEPLRSNRKRRITTAFHRALKANTSRSLSTVAARRVDQPEALAPPSAVATRIRSSGATRRPRSSDQQGGRNEEVASTKRASNKAGAKAVLWDRLRDSVSRVTDGDGAGDRHEKRRPTAPPMTVRRPSQAVIDDEERPVPVRRAVVTVAEAGVVPSRSAATDDEGRAHDRALPAGRSQSPSSRVVHHFHLRRQAAWQTRHCRVVAAGQRVRPILR